MGISRFEDVQAWQVARELCKIVYQLTGDEKFHRDFGLRDQARRAAVSIARGSVEEVKYQLLLARDLGYVDDGTYGEMAEGYDQVGRMLNKLISSLRTHLPSSTQHLKPKT